MEENLTTEQIKFAYWYLTHKKQLLKAAILVLIVFNIIVWGATAYKLITYLRSTQSYEEMLKELTLDRINWLEMHQHFRPNDLLISGQNALQTVISPGAKELRYDFIAVVRNPNTDWMISSIEYYFLWDDLSTGKETEIQKSFLLPGAKKYLFALGQKTTKTPRSVRVELSKVNWQRIRPNQRAPLEILSKISVKDIELTYVVPEEKMLSLPKVSFSVENQSVYGFWRLNFIIVLYQDNKIVGISTTGINRLNGGETRPIEFIWGTSAPFATGIEVTPEVNVFDQDIFMPPK